MRSFVLKIYDHLAIKNATNVVDEVRRRPLVAIERIRIDHGNEFGTDFTWRLRDLGIAHRHIPPGCPEFNGKVERSYRTDEDEFYRRVRIRDVADLARKLQAWKRVTAGVSRLLKNP